MKTFPHMFYPRSRRVIYVGLLLLVSTCIVYAASIPPLPQLPIDITDVGIPNGDEDCPNQSSDPSSDPVPDSTDDDCCIDPAPAPTPPTVCDPFYGLYGRKITVVIEGDYTLTGDLMLICKGFMILQNRDAGHHNVINLNKICYVELIAESN